MRKHTFLLLLSLWGASSLCAQEPKGAVPLTTHHSSLITHHSTRAVVVGISDYQDPAIPDLQFAHRDAEAFAEWLQSPAGGSVPAENIQVLLNEKATMGRVAMALWALMTQCMEGDQAIIYFSGHGDVETKTIAQPGYWLCWDSPPYAYMSGGCFNVRDLQDIVATLSLQNKARVLVISDACHAGKLAGSPDGSGAGAQATAQNLARQFANEVKILSCQPNEFSLEGMQWGGGRGCFSYHLTDGLYGLADRNEDDLVTLVELENYLEDRVPEETAPHRQFPFTVGDKLASLARVDAPTLARIKAGKAGAQPSLEPIDPRGMEDWVLARADSSIWELYAAFNAALERKELLEPKGTSADDYYRRLINEPELEPVHGLMTRNFAAALLDESQQVTNKLLKTDPEVVSDTWSRPFVFDHIPLYINRAIELLGTQHFLYGHLKAKQLYFEARRYRKENFPEVSPDALAISSRGLLEQAIQFDSTAAYILAELGKTYWFKFNLFDAGLTFCKKALMLSPNYVYAHYLAGVCLRIGKLSDAEFHLNKAIELDSTFLLSYQEISFHYLIHQKLEKQVYFREKFIGKVQALLAARPGEVPVFYRTLLGAELWRAGRLPEAEKVLKEAAELSKHQDIVVYQYLPMVLIDMERYEEALKAIEKQIELNPRSAEGYNQLAGVCEKLNQFSRAEAALENAIRVFPNSATYFELGKFYHFVVNRPEDAAAAFQKAISLDTLVQWPGTYGRCLLGEAYLIAGRTEDAQRVFQKILDKIPDQTDPLTMNYSARAYWGLGNQDKMEEVIRNAIRASPDNFLVYYHAAGVYAVAKIEDRALLFLAQALEKGYSDYRQINYDPDLQNIQATSGFKTLLKKYFPEQVKD